jgi:hypothetical protein
LGLASNKERLAPVLLFIRVNGTFVSIPVIVDIEPAEQL